MIKFLAGVGLGLLFGITIMVLLIIGKDEYGEEYFDDHEEDIKELKGSEKE